MYILNLSDTAMVSTNIGKTKIEDKIVDNLFLNYLRSSLTHITPTLLSCEKKVYFWLFSERKKITSLRMTASTSVTTNHLND